MTLSPHLIYDALSTRDSYTIEREAQLGRWRADLASIEMKTGGDNLAHQSKLTELRRDVSLAEEQLEKLKESTDDSWQDLKLAIDKDWEELSASLKKVKRELLKHLS